jgi:hypothetical protein
MKGSLAAASVEVVASKIVENGWITVFVNALPRTVPTANLCQHVRVPPNKAKCVDDPCFYFDQPKYAKLRGQCIQLLNGAIVPNAAGDVNEALSVLFSPAKYKVLDIRTYVCAAGQPLCKGSSAGANSHLDYVVPVPSVK